MSNKEFEKIYSDISFYNRVKQLSDSYYSSNRQSWRSVSIFDLEDLESEAWLKMYKVDFGKRKSFYLVVIENRFKDLLRKAKRRKEIAPRAEGKFLQLTCLNSEGKEFKAKILSSEILYGESYDEDIQ